MSGEILAIDCAGRGNFWLTLKSDHKVRFATTGAEGLEMLSEKVSLVFLNINLPDMKSMEVFRLIRKEYPSMPIMIITDGGGAETAAASARNGAGNEGNRAGKWLDAEDVLLKLKALVGANDDALEGLGEPPAAETVNQRKEGQYPGIPPHIVKGVLTVRDFIDRNYSRSLSLASACEMASLSKTYFCQYFKRITGHSLRGYHHAVKIRMAERLLADKRMSVREVAGNLGYQDPNYFSTVFRKVTGNAPRRVRAKKTIPPKSRNLPVP